MVLVGQAAQAVLVVDVGYESCHCRDRMRLHRGGVLCINAELGLFQLVTVDRDCRVDLPDGDRPVQIEASGSRGQDFGGDLSDAV